MVGIDALCKECGRPIRWRPGCMMMCKPCGERINAMVRANEVNQRVIRMVKELSRSV